MPPTPRAHRPWAVLLRVGRCTYIIIWADT